MLTKFMGMPHGREAATHAPRSFPGLGVRSMDVVHVSREGRAILAQL
jgi:hypothetical protein